MKMKPILILIIVSMSLALPALACGRGQATPSGVLLDRDVAVGAGGGSADVYFNARVGQRIRITLRAADTSLQPYGYLVYPNGDEEYTPPLDRASNGQNSVELDLTQSGDYQLSVMDGTNKGGQVRVRVEVIQ